MLRWEGLVWHDAEPFMPHRFPMRMVESVALTPMGNGWGRTRVQAHWPCMGQFGVEETSLPAEACAELVAQTYAGVTGLAVSGRVPGMMHGADPADAVSPAFASPRIGFLAGLRDFRFDGRPAHVGDTLIMELTGETSVGDVTLVEGRVFLDGEILAEGQVKIYVPPVPHGQSALAVPPAQAGQSSPSREVL